MEEDEVHERIRGPGKFATSFKRAKLFDFHRFCDGPQPIRKRARRRRRHPHANDLVCWTMPIVEQVQRNFYVLVYAPGHRQFRGAQVMRWSPSKFRDHAGPPCFPTAPGLTGTHRLHDLPHNPNGQAKKPNTDSEAAEDAHGAAQPIPYHASMAPIIERGIIALRHSLGDHRGI
jgi:hypothetical protein